MRIAVSTEIDRPVAAVWRWYAVDHVRNHPRRLPCWRAQLGEPHVELRPELLPDTARCVDGVRGAG